ncbi:phosphatase PAP2 family protein [Streptomyces sp. NPDC002825]|uniref:phosphatase PAP2 family protein n=1 Tax=Streptomyces sp. NPDC002825 TaxID=3154666 RepID=UPI00331FF3B1
MTGGSAPAALGPIAALAALGLLALGVRYSGHTHPATVDVWIQPLLVDVRPPWAYAAEALDFLGEPDGAVLSIVTVVTACLLLRQPRAAVLAVVGAALSVGATKLLKSLVGRTINGDNLSFPSGHTAFLTALALVVALLAGGRLGLGRTAGTMLVLATTLVAGAAMGWAQVVTRAHYPTDTVGGLCTALVVVPVTAWLIDRTADGFLGRPG